MIWNLGKMTEAWEERGCVRTFEVKTDALECLKQMRRDWFSFDDDEPFKGRIQLLDNGWWEVWQQA